MGFFISKAKLGFIKLMHIFIKVLMLYLFILEHYISIKIDILYYVICRVLNLLTVNNLGL